MPTLNSDFQRLVSEFSDLAVSFAREPLDPSDHQGFYWRCVIVKGFHDDFQELGHELVYRFKKDGTLAKWHTFPIWKRSIPYAC